MLVLSRTWASLSLFVPFWAASSHVTRRGCHVLAHLVLSPHTAGNCPDVLSETSGGFKLTNVTTHLPPASWHGSQLTHMQRECNMTHTEMLIFDMIIYDTNLNARGFIQATSEESDIELKHDLNWMSMSFCVCWMYKYETVCWTWKCETITHVSLSQNTFRLEQKRSSVDAVRWRCVAGVCWTVLLSSDAFKEKSIHAICERGDVRSHFKTQWRHLKPL